jgi:hypothetical protein
MRSDRPVRRLTNPFRRDEAGEPARERRSQDFGVRAEYFRRQGEQPSGRLISWLGTEWWNRFRVWTVETWKRIETVSSCRMAKVGTGRLVPRSQNPHSSDEPRNRVTGGAKAGNGRWMHERHVKGKRDTSVSAREGYTSWREELHGS